MLIGDFDIESQHFTQKYAEVATW